jgi:hypothetical protein
MICFISLTHKIYLDYSRKKKKNEKKLGMIAYACNTSTWEEGEARL